MSGNVALTPLTAYLETEEGEFPLAAVSLNHYMGMVNTAECTVATGFRVGGSVGRLPRLRRGSPARVIITAARGVQDPVTGTSLLRSGSTIGFDGIVDTDGPSDVAFGAFNAQVVLAGKCKVLDIGTLQSSDIVPKSCLDTTKALGYFSNDGSAVTSSPVYQKFNPATIRSDFWRAMQDILQAIAQTGDDVMNGNSNALQDFKRVMGGLRANSAALAVLKQIKGSLVGITDEQFSVSIANYLNQEFTSDAYKSFFNRIIEMGFVFGYRLIEQPRGMAVVPYSPFVATDAQHVKIPPSGVLGMGWVQREPNSYSGQVMMNSGPSSYSAGSGQPSWVAGAYKRPIEASPLGFVLSQPAPPFFFYPVGGGPKDKPTAQTLTSNTIVDAYARDFCLLNSYRGRSLQVTCPVRFDIGLGTPVKLLYPQLAGGALGPAVYGSVQAVRVMLDASKRTAVSSIEIGYLRSSEQFNAEAQDPNATRHPFWSQVYRGGRLDEAPAQ